MKGFTFHDSNVFGKPRPPNLGPLYNPLYADQRLKELAATGTNWVALNVHIFQDTIASTEVRRDQYGTPTDAALRHMIDLAHSLGMRVSLYLGVIHLSQDPTHYWTQIGTAFTTEEQWQAWFTSYRQITVQYATFARDAGVDMFFIGQELSGTTHRENDWRRIAHEVRQVYKGPIIYEALNSNGGGRVGGLASPPFGEEQRITWWDAVDYIGVMAYYPLTDKNNPTVEELKTAWAERGWLTLLEDLSNKYQRPIIFSEIGYESKDGANKQPLTDTFDLPLDLQEQADCYQAALEVLWGKPWLKGIFWFLWYANPLWPPSAPNDKSAFIYGKPAEEVLKKFYLSQ